MTAATEILLKTEVTTSPWLSTVGKWRHHQEAEEKVRMTKEILVVY